MVAKACEKGTGVLLCLRLTQAEAQTLETFTGSIGGGRNGVEMTVMTDLNYGEVRDLTDQIYAALHGGNNEATDCDLLP